MVAEVTTTTPPPRPASHRAAPRGRHRSSHPNKPRFRTRSRRRLASRRLHRADRAPCGRVAQRSMHQDGRFSLPARATHTVNEACGDDGGAQYHSCPWEGVLRCFYHELALHRYAQRSCRSCGDGRHAWGVRSRAAWCVLSASADCGSCAGGEGQLASPRTVCVAPRKRSSTGGARGVLGCSAVPPRVHLGRAVSIASATRAPGRGAQVAALACSLPSRGLQTVACGAVACPGWHADGTRSGTFCASSAQHAEPWRRALRRGGSVIEAFKPLDCRMLLAASLIAEVFRLAGAWSVTAFPTTRVCRHGMGLG